MHSGNITDQSPLSPPDFVVSTSVRFKTEHALVKAYVKKRLSRQRKDSVTISEFNSENGIADLVQVSLRKDWVKNIALGEINPRWAYALTQLPYRRAFTLHDFIALCGSGKPKAMSVLEDYKLRGFCISGSVAGTWIKLTQPKPLAKEIVAIEAKLINWQKALSQAYRYLDYAHESWVLLDTATARAALGNIDKFQRLNVGLMLQGQDGVVRKIFSPVKSKPRNILRFWQANSVLGKSLKIGGVVAI